MLLVEDDVDDALEASRAFSKVTGIRIEQVRTAQQALQARTREAFDAYLVDYRLPDRSGVQLVKELRDAGVKGPIILVTSIRSDAVAARAFAAGADDLIVKGENYGARLVHEVSTRMRKVPKRS